MTIAAAFFCKDGLTMAVDRQFTSPETYKYHGKKYTEMAYGPTEVVYVFSGDPGCFAEIQQRMETHIVNSPQDVTCDVIRDALNASVTEIRARDFDADIRLLIGVWDLHGEVNLVIYNGKSAFIGDKDKPHVLAYGDTSIIRFLADHLYRPEMSGAEATAVATYLIKKATQYLPDCGEPIDVVFFDWLGIEVLEQDKTGPVLTKMEEQEELLFTLIVQTPLL